MLAVAGDLHGFRREYAGATLRDHLRQDAGWDHGCHV